MTYAYDKCYLEKAQTALGRMFDYAVYDLAYDLTEFFNLFISTGTAEDFGKGDFTLIVGKSGVELAWEVLDRAGLSKERVKPKYTYDRSEEYWTGWALAYYQWFRNLSFSEIICRIPIEEVRGLYYPYHEMDIRQFVDKMDEMYEIRKK